MVQLYERKKDCCGCSACSSVCPQNAIEMLKDEYGFRYPIVDQEKCNECGLCLKTCSFQKNHIKDRQPIVYAAFNKNNDERMSSSSGGIFIEIAKCIIGKSGAVYGAKFDKEFNVHHHRETNIQGIRSLQGSKYVQSDMENCYKEICKDLISNKSVLFVGVPCQVSGLKAYLGRDYNNLYLVDLACHGVASPKIWKSYIRKNAKGREIKSVSFRDKSEGWKKYCLKIMYASDSYIASQYKDPYMNLFLNRLILRESCFNCPYNSYSREGDITLADFWGIEIYKPYLDDNKGISVVLINTERGEYLFNQVKENLIVETSNKKECLQRPFERCMQPNRKSKRFWELYNEDEYKAIDLFGRYSLNRVFIVRIIIPVLRKMGLYRIVMVLMGKKRVK